MRIKLVLRPRLQSATIPINYQYPLSAAIYKILQQASPDDPELSEALRHNLLQKYRIIHGRPPEDAELTFRLNAADKPKSKLISIKQSTPQETKIRCFESYFTLQGSPKLMQTAWQCGLGEHNSQGFGMIEVVRQPA